MGRDKSTKNDGYGPKGVICSRKPTQNCYNIPRKIQVEVCKNNVHRYFEKFSNIFPFPVEEQNCHFEPKKICELEMKTRPKKAKKYSYTKDCKEQPREICDQCEKKNLRKCVRPRIAWSALISLLSSVRMRRSNTAIRL